MAGTGRRARDLALVIAALVLASATTAHLLTATAMSSYGTASPVLLVADLVAGWALVISGSWSFVADHRRGLGSVVVWLSISWLSADWIGSSAGDGWVRMVALPMSSVFTVLLLHGALTLPDGRAVARRVRAALIAAYVLVVLLAMFFVVGYDPFTDPDCWQTCQRNAHLLIATPGAAEAIGMALRATQLVVAGAAAVIALRWVIRGPRRSRLMIGPMAAPIAVVSLANAASILLNGLVTAEAPEQLAFAIAYAGQAIGLVVLAASPVWAMLRNASIRRAVRMLTHPVTQTQPAHSLADLLREALGDPTLEVAYPVGSGGRLVDAHGQPFAPATVPATSLLRGDRVVAFVYREPRPGDAPLTAQQLGAAARLAVDNERLRAELLAQVEEVRASQARVIEASDAARSRLERDLHDGAQQRVLALLYELQRAREQAATRGSGEGADTLAAACHDAETALAELRDIAHGIFPAILDDAGLSAAIETLRDVIDVPVIVERLPDDRFTPAVERAAYTVVAGALEGSVGTTTTPRIDLWRHDGALSVRVDRLAEPVPDDAFDRMATRVEALRGELLRGPLDLRAELPCG